MDVRLIEQTVKDVQCDALVIGVSYKEVGQQNREVVLAEKAKEVNSLLGGLLKTMYDDGEFKAELGEMITVHPLSKLAAKRVVVMGLGSRTKMTAQSISLASAIASRYVYQIGAHKLAYS